MARVKQTVRKSIGRKAPRKRQKVINKKYKPNIITLKYALKLHVLLKEIPESLLKECLNEIIPLFGGIQSLLMFITNNCNSNQINGMYEITRRIHVQFQHNQSKNTKQMNNISSSKPDSDTRNSTNNISNSFNLISNESIANICSFLTKNDIKSFKLCSRRSGIVCLSEMNKICITILNLNKFINKHNYNYFDTFNDKYFEELRYNKNNYIYQLQQKWEEKYNIKPQNQLLLKQTKCRCDTYGLVNMNMEKINKIKTEKYLLCDSTKLVVLTKNDSHLYDINRDKFDYKLMKLEYFNIETQSLNFIQFILYSKNISYNRLFKYIEFEFIEIFGTNNNWYNKLKMCLLQMNNNNNHSKLMVYKHTGKLGGYYRETKTKFTTQITHNNHKIYVYSKWNCTNSNVFTFQLNPSHPWFGTTNICDKIIKIKEKHKEKSDIFVPFAKEYFNRQDITIDLKKLNNTNVLGKAFETYYKLRFNKNERNIFDKDLKIIYDIIKDGNIKLKCNPLLPIECLRMKLVKLFDFIIEPKYIQILYPKSTRRSYYRRYTYEPNYEDAKPNQLVKDFRNLYIYISMYDCLSFDKLRINNEYSNINIRIYKPNQLPYPLYFKKECVKQIMVKYKKNNFKLKELANILYNYYRDLIDIYCGFEYDIDDDDTEMTDEYINRKNYDQIKIMASKPIGNHCKHLDLYEMSDIIEFKEK